MGRFLLIFILLLTTSCNKSVDNSPRLDCYFYELHVGDKPILTGENLHNITWISDYPFVATTSYGYINTLHVGEANFYCSENQLGFKVKITPRYSFFSKRIHEWYAEFPFGSKWEDITVKHYMEILDNDMSGVVFNKDNNNAVLAVIYHFDKSNKMDYFSLAYDINKVERLAECLKERYEPYAQLSDYDYIFIHRDKHNQIDLYVYVTIVDPIILVVFSPTATKAGDIDLEALHKMVENEIN